MNQSAAGKRASAWAAWAAMLAISDLPEIILVRLGTGLPAWMTGAKVAFLAAFAAATLAIRALHRLRPYALALFTLFLALGLTGVLRSTAWFQGHFNYQGVPYFTGFAAVMVLDVLVALAVLAVLWFMRRDRRAFFLAKGDPGAPIAPIRWLGIGTGESWGKFTWIFAGIASLAVAVPTFLVAAPTASMLLRALPMLPAALLFAAVNAFTEEAYFRCSLISTLHEVIGRGQTLGLILVFFGLSHWLYGSPNGIVGFAMTGFLSWIMARSMLETRGMLSAWTIHFFPDVVVFFSYALAFVK
ncbi:MAG TPA: CPBP family intramembrane metalloprotease [Candidatus Aminicenantes bacterium]|nr:CPBP family intramembrane metalloprotease [Candidatus Aminicenantes bacterium]